MLDFQETLLGVEAVEETFLLSCVGTEKSPAKRGSPTCAVRSVSSESGISVLEVIVTMFLIAILMGSTVSSLRELNRPLHNGSEHTVGFVKQVRARAVATTLAYTIQPISATRIGSFFANSCADTTPTNDDQLFLDLPLGVQLDDTSWSTCFNGRGLANTNVNIPLSDNDGNTRTVEVFLGGAARVAP